MRLGYLIPEFPSQTHVFFWREAVELRAAGVQVELISTKRPSGPPCRHEFAAGAAAQTHYLFPPRVAGAMGQLLLRPWGAARSLAYVAGLRESSIARRMKCLAYILCAAELLRFSRQRQLDHIHVHSCAEAAHVAALCRVLGGPSYSLTLHGDLPVYGVDHRSKASLAKFVSCAGPHLCKPLMEATGLPADRIVANYMGLDTRRFIDAGRHAMQPGKLHLVTVARLDPCKGHRHALAAMRRAIDAGCDIRYTIAGQGSAREELQRQIDQLGLRDRVEMPGTVGEDDVLQLLQRADAFILPSVGMGEAGPVSVMEAMACGLPVIASIIGATPMMIDHGQSGLLVKQGDEPALADAMILLANDVDMRRRLGQRARERAVEMFDVRQTAQRLLNAIARPTARAESV